MRRFLLFALLLPLASHVRAQAPAPAAAPDYHALYLTANDAAARWKAVAEQMQTERDAARSEQEVARKERDGLRREMASVEVRNRWQADQLRGKAPADTPQPSPAPKAATTRTEVVLARKEHRLLPELHEWVTFLGADAQLIRMSIGPGSGTRQDFPMRRGLEGGGNNETLIVDDGYGHRLLYVDTVRSHGGSGVFIIESASR